MNIQISEVTKHPVSEKLTCTLTHQDLAITLMDAPGYFFLLYKVLSV